MLAKNLTSTSKIPVRDLTPMFNTMENANRSRRETFSASFNPPQSVVASTETKNKNQEKIHKFNDKIKDLKHLLNARDNEILELKATVTELLAQKEQLLKDKSILIENYNSLTEKLESFDDERKDKIEFLEKENSEIKNDLKMLKILVFRLNKHIEYYQETLNEKAIKFDPPSTYDDPDENASTWPVHSNILSPLMNSYEERIKEKNDIIKSYESELCQFTVKLKKILDENEKIQELYENQSKNAEMWIIERQRLMSQCELLKNKATIHAKRADLAKEKLYEVLKVYEQKMQSQSLDIERLQEAYNRSKGEITSLKNLQKNPEIVTQHVRECQKLLEDLRMQFEVEKTQMMDEKKNMETQLSQQKDKITELENIISTQKLCNEALTDKNKLLKKTLYQERQSRESSEQDANQIRQYGRETWQTIADLQNLIQEKENIIQTLRATHQEEINELIFKLQKREETLKKVLKAKLAQGSTKC